MNEKNSIAYAIGAQAYYPGQAYNTPAMLQLAALIDVSDGDFLDIGCGDGQLLRLLCERYPGATYHGLTVSDEERIACGHRFDVQIGDMQKLPWNQSSMDVVVSRHSLEHSISPLTALFEINRVLRLGGRCYVVVPAPVSEWVVKWKDHFSVLPKAMWEKLFDDAGFVIDSFEEGSWLASFSMSHETEFRFVLRKVRDTEAGRLAGVDNSNMCFTSTNSNATQSIAPIVDKKIVVVLHNLVLFDAVRAVVDRFKSDVKILVPDFEGEGFAQMSRDTVRVIREQGYLAELTQLPADVSCDIELSPYPYAEFNVRRAKWRVRFMYGLAKEAWNFSLENNFYYDFVLAYGDYDAAVLSAYTTPVVVGNPKIRLKCSSGSASGNKPQLLYLPTYGATSSIEKVCSQLEDLKRTYCVLIKPHHGTTYLEPERLKMLAGLADELFDHTVSLANLLEHTDIVLSDGSGAIFDAIAACLPIVVYQDKTFAGLGGSVSLEEKLVQDGILPVVTEPSQLLGVLNSARSCGVGRYVELRSRLFSRLGDDAADAAVNFIKALVSNPDHYKGYSISRVLIREKLELGVREKNAGKIAERQLDDAYRRLTNQLLEDINGSRRVVYERDAHIATLNQAMVERDGQIASLNQAVADFEVRIASFGQEMAERDRRNASLNQAVAERDGQIVSLNQAVTESEGQIAYLHLQMTERDVQTANLNAALAERDRQVASFNQLLVESDLQIARLQQEMALRYEQLKEFFNSTSWRVTRPLRLVKRLSLALRDESERYRLLKTLYWKLPEFLRLRLNERRYRYVARQFHARDTQSVARESAKSSPLILKSSQDWVTSAKSAEKIIIIPCGFEFDELVNQRPINAAKFFAQEGYLVLFVAWQWSRGEVLAKGTGQVWRNVYQVSLFDLIDYGDALPIKKLEAIYLLTLPAKILVDLVPVLRTRAYSIVYDIMDDWEEFHKLGQAPWFDCDVERSLVLQSDVICAVAPALIEKFSGMRDDIHLIGNGYAPEMLGVECRGISGKDDKTKTTVGYFGHLTDAWFDWSLVFELADSQPSIQFDLIGYGEPEWVRERVMLSPNVNLLGKVHPKKLNEHVRRWSFGMIPFIEGELARAVDPIKIYEYLYFGLPALVTGIEHLQSYPNVCFATRNDALCEFDKLLKQTTFNDSNLDSFLVRTTWRARFSHLRSCIAQNKVLGDMYVF